MSTAAVLRVAARSSSSPTAIFRSPQATATSPRRLYKIHGTRGGYGGRCFTTSLKRGSGAAHDPHGEETFEEFTARCVYSWHCLAGREKIETASGLENEEEKG